jgi:hypothetical protein
MQRKLTFRLVSPPGGPLSSLGIASRSDLTKSIGVLCFVLKKFIVDQPESLRETGRGTAIGRDASGVIGTAMM